jgi:hypothetical protein
MDGESETYALNPLNPFNKLNPLNPPNPLNALNHSPIQNREPHGIGIGIGIFNDNVENNLELYHMAESIFSEAAMRVVLLAACVLLPAHSETSHRCSTHCDSSAAKRATGKTNRLQAHTTAPTWNMRRAQTIVGIGGVL